MNNIICNTEYFNTADKDASEALCECILKRLSAVNINDYTPVILCIGTDRATGDCLGPLVGEKLQHYNNSYQVYGCLSHPVHALNLVEVNNYIKTNIDNPYVIAIDAALGSSSHIGYITVSDCSLSPGKGVNKKLPAVGDLSITGIVNISGRNPGVLQNTRLNLVMQLADCIANALKYSIDYLEDFCPL